MRCFLAKQPASKLSNARASHDLLVVPPLPPSALSDHQIWSPARDPPAADNTNGGRMKFTGRGRWGVAVGFTDAKRRENV